MDIGKNYEYMLANSTEIELIGLCTDICVISNALILKAFFPDVQITVDVSCCAGTTLELHEAAIKVMKSCQVNRRRAKMKVKIERGTTFGWYSYVWNENENEYKLITFSLTKLGAKCALKRYKNTRNRVKEYEYEI